MNGDRMAVGASTSDLPATSAGAVYVFTASGGSYALQQKLVIDGGTNGDLFGCSVALEGTTLIGGAREDSPVPGKPAYGAAYVFEFNGSLWIPQGKLMAADGATVDRFGWSVAAGKNVVAIGAREDDTTAGPDAGSVYVFVRSGATWKQQQKLSPTDTFNGDRFGAGLAFINNTQLLVGAAEKALSGPNGQGAAYTFVTSTAAISRSTRFDYDGDGKADVSVFRPANGQWWHQQSADNTVRSAIFGVATDKPVPADYDGDGKTDLAVFRPSTGEWFVLRSADQSLHTLKLGMSTDIAIPADFDGDGKADLAVFRADAAWHINKSSGGTQISQWGVAGDIPVPADYDGDGKSDLAIFRPGDGSWRLNRSTAGTLTVNFGVTGDRAVPADFSGDGKADIALWRPSNGTWHVLNSEDSGSITMQFGTDGDAPLPADYDGDGKADLAVFRPGNATWFAQRSAAGILVLQFGLAGDKPTAAAFID
jgi:hypothetical protein